MNIRQSRSSKSIPRNIFKISSKKGFTYLLVTTVIVAVLLSIFFATSRYKYQDQEALEQVRVRALNDFVKNFNNDIHRATYISAFRALLALEDHVAFTGNYLTNVNESFRETFFYGTIDGTSSAIMLNSTFEDYINKVEALASATGILLDVNVTQIRLMQSDPWIIDVYISMNITILDVKNTSSWNIDNEYISSVPITNLRDPLYSKNTNNTVPNTIRKLNTDILVNGTDTAYLQEHINGSYYLASPYAPNFVMRFEGRTDSDVNGIESIVNVLNLVAQGRPRYDDRIKVDYIYFNNLPEEEICDVQNIDADSYFVLPANRIQLYQIENPLANLTYSNSSVCP